MERNLVQVDKMVVVALLRSMVKYNSFAVYVVDIEEELKELIKQRLGRELEDEDYVAYVYDPVDKFEDAVRSGKLPFLYYFEGLDVATDNFSTIAVVPLHLTPERIVTMNYVYDLIADGVLTYREEPDASPDMSVKIAMDALIRMFLKETLRFEKIDDVGYAVYVLAKYYGLDVKFHRTGHTWYYDEDIFFMVPEVGVYVVYVYPPKYKQPTIRGRYWYKVSI
jgi:hypothetical protein